MKRLGVVLLTSGLLWFGSAARAIDSVAPTTADRPKIEAALPKASGLERAELLYQLTELDRSSEPQAALDTAREALALLQRQTEFRSRELNSLLQANLAWSYSMLGDYARAQREAERGLMLARELGSQRAEARNLNTLGVISRNLGDAEGALNYFQQTLVLEDALGNLSRKTSTLNNLGVLFLNLKRLEDAFAMLRQAEQLARSIGDEKLQAYSCSNLSEAYIRAGEFQLALDWAQRAAAIPSQQQQPYVQAHIQHNRGLALSGLKQSSAARAAFAQALALRDQIGDEAGEANTRSELARLAMQQGDFREANQQMAQAEAISKRIGNRTQLQEVLETKTQLLEAQGDLRGALTASREREQLARDIFSERAALRIGQFESRQSLAQRENQIALLTRENEIQQLQVRQQQLTIWSGSLAALLLLVIGLLIFFRLRHRRQTAEAAAASRSRFLAQMSHEIRTPMTGIIGVSELLQDTPLNGEQRELLQTIRQSGEALLGLVNDILDLSKLDAGRLQLHEQTFDLRQLLESVLDVFALQAEQKQLTLLYELPLTAPVRVHGDPLRLRQILLNLLGNAIKFTEQGSVTLHARWRGEAGARQTLELVVEDTGIGIAPEQQAQMFEPFAQGVADARALVGTGLGLTISRQLARLMGGEISLESTIGKGSRFIVQIQLSVLETAPAAIAALPVPAVFGYQLPAELHQQLQQLLAQAGVRYVEVGSVGPASLIAARPALLLLPASSDAATRLTSLKQQLPGCRILLLAGPQARKQLRDRQLQADGIVPLPLRPAELFSSLLPPAVLPEPTLAAAPLPSVNTVSPLASHGQRQVLIVDDNDINRRVAQKLLERFAFQVTSLDGGRAAAALLQQRRFDAVFMDCQMPDMDGFDATRAIREHEQNGEHQLIIAMTAHALKGDREQCLAAGMDDYLTKPVKLDALAEVLKRWNLLTASVQEA
ncbi:response regulator [Permianibacter sp. IMCC34836]|uniref:response regulator n=1 Tax=Permianibacter fluminis TaxID=2738515 RepID=UPI0015580A95|nr:response regulator [Permianibacter fluminis]NQD36327.1 response regulator [Permianibacter fluminis]